MLECSDDCGCIKCAEGEVLVNECDCIDDQYKVCDKRGECSVQ